MTKKTIIIFFVLTGIVSNAFSSNQISFSIPDSPNYYSSTWYDANWASIDVSNEAFISDWSITFTWVADDYPEDATFYALSPSDTQIVISSGVTSGTYTITSSSFNNEPTNGIWYLWIDDSYNDGGCGAVDITMSIVLSASLIVNIPEKAAEGMESITGTVIANQAPEKDIIVQLHSNNTERLAVQSETTIKAGEDRADFSMSIVDDQLLNGSSEVQILASAPNYISGTANLIIDDNESASLTLMLPDEVINGNTIQAKIGIDQNLDLDTKIQLLNATDINIQPETVLMPAGISEITFDLTFLGENIAQSISITPSVANWEVYGDTINFIPKMISESERQALIDLYNSTDGANWYNSENWLSERGTECSWRGVYCVDIETGKHVKRIVLSNNNLTGEILASIDNLQNLSELELYGNNLTSLPESLGNLQNLSSLKLYNNQLRSLPESFGNLQNLSSLSLFNNQLSSLPESFGNLQNLSFLELYNNYLISLPESIGNLQNLSSLISYNNYFTTLPESFGNLQKLSYLNLSDNELISLPESFGNLVNLSNLNLSINELISLPESFGSLQNLSYLDLFNNELISLPESFGNLVKLSNLNLLDNELVSLPDSFGNLQNLSYLKLENNHLINLPESIGNLVKLSNLNLSKNELVSLPESFGNLQNLSTLNLLMNELISLPESFGDLKNLSSLYLTNNKLISLPESFGDLKKLSFLYLTNNKLICLPENFGNLQNLSFLEIDNNQLKNLPESFGNLQKLSSLEIDNNQLKNLPDSFGNLQNLSSLNLNKNELISLPESFVNLQNLSKLYLFDNKLTSLPESFGNLQNLSTLLLPNNELTLLPESLGNLQKLSSLTLQNNKLSSLPESFVNLQNLSFFNLDNMQLTSLPESIDKLQNLTSIILSNNKLSSLPESFGNLQNLSALDLSNNELTHLPESFDNLQSLKMLNVSNNKLARLPESFGNIESLEDLYLSDNALSILPESFVNLNNLSKLNLSGNELSSLPESFGNLNNLSELILSNNTLSSLPDNFTSLDKYDDKDNNKLTHLDISTNQLDNLPQNFEDLINIDYLDISINKIKILPQNIGNLTKLRYLNISRNQIQVLPESIDKCTPLSTLNISFNKLKSIPSSIGDLKVLQFLDISNNIIEEVPESLKNLSNLKEINLSHNKLQEIPYQLSDIISLQEINLSENLITEIKDEIQYFTNLLTLNLSNNHLQISDKIEKLSNLQSLVLSGCYLLENELPAALFNLSNLRYLSLSDNILYKIPENLYKLKSLITLNLENNFFSGNIDESLFHLLNLRSLDLSVEFPGNNPLQGDIPLELSKLKNLIYLDLDGTKLYTTSPALEKFITDINPKWNNEPPELIERSDLCIKSITSSSDNMRFPLNSKISILVAMTQPVTLTGGELIITLETGDTDRVIYAPPFALSNTATAIYTVQEGDFSKGLNVKSIILADGASLTNEDGEPVDLALIPDINLAARQKIYVDGTLPSLEIIDPNNPCEENLYKITGTAADLSKDFSVTLTIFDEQNNPFPSEVKNFFKNASENWAFDTAQFNLQKDASYRIQVDVKDFVGNINTLSRSVTFGKKPSTIVPHLSQKTIVFGQTIIVTGNISPPESLIGEEVIIKLVSPSGKEPGRKVNANEDGSFEYVLQCSDIDQAGLWQVVALWDGTSCLDPAISEPQILTVEKASCNVALDATQISVKLGDQVSIAGQVMPEYYCEGHMINIPVDLMVSGPKGINEIELQTNNSAGQFIQSNYTGFDSLGEWQIAASVKNNSYLASFSDMIHINVVET
ncbi:MAG: leucine-rich repeat protein, partial [Candidatus Magnetomorum sp.]|nr:leucine-rich repeat protein [Candidatus Magnetomorum sp.]